MKFMLLQSNQNENIPVYKVKTEDSPSSEKTLHRNHLLYLGDKLLDMPETLDEQLIKPQHEQNYD